MFKNVAGNIVLAVVIALPLALHAETDIDVLRHEAKLPKTSKPRLAELARNPSSEIRLAVAQNRRTQRDVLAELARDPVQAIRIAVATNLSSDERIYELLVADKDVAVRSVVARFEYVPVSALMRLAKDENPDIRLEVARNWNADEQVLNLLINDPVGQVQRMAEMHLQAIHNNEEWRDR